MILFSKAFAKNEKGISKCAIILPAAEEANVANHILCRLGVAAEKCPDKMHTNQMLLPFGIFGSTPALGAQNEHYESHGMGFT